MPRRRSALAVWWQPPRLRRLLFGPLAPTLPGPRTESASAVLARRGRVHSADGARHAGGLRQRRQRRLGGQGATPSLARIALAVAAGLFAAGSRYRGRKLLGRASGHERPDSRSAEARRAPASATATGREPQGLISNAATNPRHPRRLAERPRPLPVDADPPSHADKRSFPSHYRKCATSFTGGRSRHGPNADHGPKDRTGNER